MGGAGGMGIAGIWLIIGGEAEVHSVGLEEEVGTGCLQVPDTVAGCWMLDFGRS